MLQRYPTGTRLSPGPWQFIGLNNLTIARLYLTAWIRRPPRPDIHKLGEQPI